MRPGGAGVVEEEDGEEDCCCLAERYSRAKAWDVKIGPRRLALMFLYDSSGGVSINGWTETYPAALTRMLGKVFVFDAKSAMAAKASSTEGADVMSHSWVEMSFLSGEP